jgi:hypothetical protein
VESRWRSNHLETGILLSNRLTLFGSKQRKAAENGTSVSAGDLCAPAHTILISFAAAYFTQTTIDQLSTVDDIPRIRELAIPEGMFKSTRLAKNRARADESKSSDASKVVTSRSYAAYPTPYQYQSQTLKNSPSMPIFMHDPYQARQSAEPHSPASYDTSHSPVPRQDGGHYHQSQVAYPNENGSQSFSTKSYHRPSITLRKSIASFSHSRANDMRPSARQDEVTSYYPSSGSPSPWSNENALDYSNSPPPPPQRLPADIGMPSSPLSHLYHPAIVYPIKPTTARSVIHSQSPASMQNHSTPLYSTPYSMNSGYSPLPPPPALTLPNPAERGGHLSPLSIPERSNGVHYPQDSSPISPVATLQNGTESYVRAAVPALAPLNVIRRPIHRREPQDELTFTDATSIAGQSLRVFWLQKFECRTTGGIGVSELGSVRVLLAFFLSVEEALYHHSSQVFVYVEPDLGR